MPRMKTSSKRSRPRLSEKSIAKILELLDGWQGPLTWERLLEAIEAFLGYKYTRQALHLHESIRIAFRLRKSTLMGKDATQRRGSLGIISAQERIMRLEASVARLQNENQALKLMFTRWAYNASTRGLDETFLNMPLPAIDREISKAGSMRHRH